MDLRAYAEGEEQWRNVDLIVSRAISIRIVSKRFDTSPSARPTTTHVLAFRVRLEPGEIVGREERAWVLRDGSGEVYKSFFVTFQRGTVHVDITMLCGNTLTMRSVPKYVAL